MIVIPTTQAGAYRASCYLGVLQGKPGLPCTKSQLIED